MFLLGELVRFNIANYLSISDSLADEAARALGCAQRNSSQDKTELKEKRENKEMQRSDRKHIRAVGWDGGKANIY